jgi:hypothetical protein
MTDDVVIKLNKLSKTVVSSSDDGNPVDFEALNDVSILFHLNF